jgi:hypothetical protein
MRALIQMPTTLWEDTLNNNVNTSNHRKYTFHPRCGMEYNGDVPYSVLSECITTSVKQNKYIINTRRYRIE